MSGSEKRKLSSVGPCRIPRLEGIPADSWPLRIPKTEKVARQVRRRMSDTRYGYAQEAVRLVKIADMHTMQLVNVIKFMLRCAKNQIANSKPLSNVDVTALRLLSYSDHWKSLLDEGSDRELKMIFWSRLSDDGQTEEAMIAPWYVAAREELLKAGRG